MMGLSRVSLGARYLDALITGRTDDGYLPQDLTALLDAARQAPVPEEYGDEYALIAPYFDHAYYFGRARDVARARLDPVAHYIRAGAAAGLDPAPFFSGAAYLRAVPQARTAGLTPLGHWVTHGADPDLAAACATETDFPALADLFGQAPKALHNHLHMRFSDLRTRLVSGDLGRMAARASLLEPLIAQGWAETLAPRLLPMANEQVMGRILALSQMQSAAQWRRARSVLVMGHPGGASEASCVAMAHALSRHMPGPDILVLQLGTAGFDPVIWQDVAAAGIRLIAMPDTATDLTEDTCARIQSEFLRALRPEVCICAAAGAGANPVWALIKTYGRQLAATTALVAWLPEAATLTGALSAQLYRTFDCLAGLWLPTEDCVADITRHFCLDPTDQRRLAVLPAHGRAAHKAGPQAGHIVSIAGASATLNAPETDRLMALAAHLPATQFSLLLDRAGKQQRYRYFPDHVTVHVAGMPEYERAARHADIWLDTGTGGPWLRQMALQGTPIVAPAAACHAAGLDPALCWCTPKDSTDLAALAAALKAALNAPEKRQDKADALAKTLSAPPYPALEPVLRQLARPAPPTAPKPAVVPGSVQDAPLLTVAITAHGESHVAGPTLRSIQAALSSFHSADVDIIVGFDSPSTACQQFFDHALPTVLPQARCFEYAFRDQGQTRTALATQARGRFLAFVDADDLISENWLARGVDLLQTRAAQGIDTIAHPEVNWQFDGVQRIYSNPDQDDPLFSPHAMAICNYYDAICIAPTRLWHDLPYAHRDIAAGFALEDYQWFVEATALGWRHANVPGTIVFKRRRDVSQHRESAGRKALIRAIEPLAIDQIRTLGAHPVTGP